MSQQPHKHLVILEPAGRRVEVEEGVNLLTAAQQAGVDLVAACGGVGVCGLCRLRLVNGELSALTASEEEHLPPQDILEGFRLACQAQPLSDVTVEIPSESLPRAQKMLLEGREAEVAPEPAVCAVEVCLPPPSQEDLRADFTRVSEALSAGEHPLEINLDTTAVCLIAEPLRRQEWTGRLAMRTSRNGAHLVSVLRADAPLVGLAVDLGSTKIAVYLVNLESGATLASAGVMNPQIAYGEDVVSRIAFANQGAENSKLLQTRVVEVLNATVADLCRQRGVSQEQIVDAVVVGNTAMHHLLCGLPVRQLGMAPYVPAVADPIEVRATELGLEIARGAWVYLPANIAGYVGADHTAALLASQAYTGEKTMILVDIGTNTEISLAKRGRLLTCSTASGPAFEGAHIHDGMRAAPGAVESVHIGDDGVQVNTVGGSPAVGICGTGVLKAISEMLDRGIVDRRGALRKRGTYAGWFNENSEFVLVPADQSGHGRQVVVTRRDVHEIQLAKAAIRAGIEILLVEAGIAALRVEQWVIAGAFGTFLDIGSAVRVGMFPDIPHGYFHQVGNAAGMGAKQMLLSRRKRTEAARLARRVRYIELTAYADFTEKFMEMMYFPVYNEP